VKVVLDEMLPAAVAGLLSGHDVAPGADRP